MTRTWILNKYSPLVHFINGVANYENQDAIMCEMYVESKRVKMQVDCGATVNIIPKSNIGDTLVSPANITLQMWNKETLDEIMDLTTFGSRSNVRQI